MHTVAVVIHKLFTNADVSQLAPGCHFSHAEAPTMILHQHSLILLINALQTPVFVLGHLQVDDDDAIHNVSCIDGTQTILVVVTANLLLTQRS